MYGLKFGNLDEQKVTVDLLFISLIFEFLFIKNSVDLLKV